MAKNSPVGIKRNFVVMLVLAHPGSLVLREYAKFVMLRGVSERGLVTPAIGVGR